jgi:dTDP-4-dehydrorhamnose reductase
MIVLIGHGYVGEYISRMIVAKKQTFDFEWIKHTDPIPKGASVIINAAGYTGNPNVDACETNKAETIDGNVVFPLMLESNNKDTPIIHIGSGCVYGGYKDGGWTEEDEPNFTFGNGSFYSGAKALGQQALAPFLNKSYLLRIRMPFGDDDHDKNFLTKMKKYNKLISYENSLSYLPDVADVVMHFAYKLPKPGIYNVCNPGSSNAKDISKMMNLEKEFFTEEEFKAATVAPRSNCVMNVDKLQAIYPLQPVEMALKKAIANL